MFSQLAFGLSLLIPGWIVGELIGRLILSYRQEVVERKSLANNEIDSDTIKVMLHTSGYDGTGSVVPPGLRPWARAEAVCAHCDWWAATDRSDFHSILEPRLREHLKSTGHDRGRVVAQ